MTKTYHLLPLLTVVLAGCATRGPLAPGNYVESHGPKIIMFEGRELRLYSDSKFSYLHYSDVVGNDRWGGGTYQMRGRQLKLTFETQPPAPVSSVQTRPLVLAAQSDSLTLTFNVRMASEPGTTKPLPGATVLLKGSTLGASSDVTGQAVLRLARSMSPRAIVISMIGFQVVERPIPDTSTEYDVLMQNALGAPYAAGTVLPFRVLRRTTSQLVLRRGTRTTNMVLQIQH